MKSFTLIELLIVLIIIGVLATLAIPQYQNMAEKSRFSQACMTMGTIFRAQEAYKAETGDYLVFMADAGSEHNPEALGLELIDIRGDGILWGDKYFYYECNSGWANPVYTEGWSCLASPHGWTPKMGKSLLLDFSENKIKIHKADNSWGDYQ